MRNHLLEEEHGAIGSSSFAAGIQDRVKCDRVSTEARHQHLTIPVLCTLKITSRCARIDDRVEDPVIRHDACSEHACQPSFSLLDVACLGTSTDHGVVHREVSSHSGRNDLEEPLLGRVNISQPGKRINDSRVGDRARLDSVGNHAQHPTLRTGCVANLATAADHDVISDAVWLQAGVDHAVPPLGGLGKVSCPHEGPNRAVERDDVGLVPGSLHAGQEPERHPRLVELLLAGAGERVVEGLRDSLLRRSRIQDLVSFCKLP
mmetsp:Transcript_25881/g.45915  ORF Transcript_25881/g.45915 Transcript_25881/m.45915 type:complete len:262 (-) Transcript_25881:218-1003(-)